MNQIEAGLRAVMADLDGVADVALVGGMAISARVEPRLTRDVDLAVSVVDDAAAETVIRSLNQRRYTVQMMLEHRTGRLATVRMAPPAGGPVLVDLLFASSGIEPEIVREAEALEVLPGLVVATARAEHLLAMKLLAEDARSRPNDHDDIVNLLKEASPSLKRTRELLSLIRERGFDRGRDLDSSLDRFIQIAER